MPAPVSPGLTGVLLRSSARAGRRWCGHGACSGLPAMKTIAFAALAALVLTVGWSAPSFADCPINLKIKNDNPEGSGTIIWVWFQDGDSRNKKTGGTFWNRVCGSGDDCTCPTYTSIYPGEEYTCATHLEDSCGSDDRDFDLVYDEGASESDKWVVGAVKAKRNIEIWDGKTVTFTWQ
jgi:hypothetical protein